MSDVFEWLEGRRSIRRYRPDPLSPELIDRLLVAAAWAPSAHNRQPWRFAVITSRETKSQLAAAMGQRLRADLMADLTPPEIIEADVKRSYRRITNAPVCIMLCLSMLEMDAYPDEQRKRYEWVMAVQSTAMAGQNLLLAAHALGLGACWMCAPLFCPEVVSTVLELPQDWEPQAMITAGYPAETRAKARHPLERLVRRYSQNIDM